MRLKNMSTMGVKHYKMKKNPIKKTDYHQITSGNIKKKKNIYGANKNS